MLFRSVAIPDAEAPVPGRYIVQVDLVRIGASDVPDGPVRGVTRRLDDMTATGLAPIRNNSGREPVGTLGPLRRDPDDLLIECLVEQIGRASCRERV